MQEFDQLVEHLRKFPGVGNRQARRFAYFLLRSNRSYTDELVSLLRQNKTHMKLCPVSFQYFYSDDSSITTAPIVRDPNRDRSTLMIVTKDMDIEAVEQTHVYKGWYFVLGGLVPIVSSRSPVQLRIDDLKEQITKRSGEIKEVIFGLPLTPDGEHTRQHLQALLDPLSREHGFAMSTLGRGLSTGTELEYIDEATFTNALTNRG